MQVGFVSIIQLKGVDIMQTVITIGTLVLYIVFNLITARKWSAREMKRDFVDGQCLVGKIFANIFYAPAWFLKGVRYVVVTLVK